MKKVKNYSHLNNEIWGYLTPEARSFVGEEDDCVVTAISINPDAEPKGRPDDAMWASHYLNEYVKNLR